MLIVQRNNIHSILCAMQYLHSLISRWSFGIRADKHCPMNLAALKFISFRRYLIANIISLNGLWVQRVTIGWIAWELTGSASFVGLIAFLSYIPTMLTGPIFGVLVDRINLRHAAMTTQSLFCLIAFTAFLLQANGLLTPVMLCVIAILIGIVTSAQHPIRMAFMPRLVPKEYVGSVIVLIALNFNLARVIGPGIGGLIIATSGVKVALLVTAIAYVPAIITIATLKYRRRARNNAKSTILMDFIEGLRFVKASAFIAKTFVLTGLFSLTARGVLEILPTIADGSFGKGATGLGVLTAAAGVGALAASVLKSFARVPETGQLPTSALIAAFSGPVLVLLLGVTQFWPVAIAAVAGLGFFGTIVGISVQTGIQMQLDDGIRGRVMSLWAMIALGATATGSVLIGALIDLVGLGLTLQSAGGASALLIILLIWRR